MRFTDFVDAFAGKSRTSCFTVIVRVFYKGDEENSNEWKNWAGTFRKQSRMLRR
jgi:hypothetical protein